MIKVMIERDQKTDIIRFSVRGHADFVEYEKDVVCAGVSAIVQSSLIGLIKYVGLEVDFQREKGKMDCTLPSGISSGKRKEANAILESMVLGIHMIEDVYKENVIIIDHK